MTERRWADLKLWRLCLGMLIAPSPPIVAFLALTAAMEQTPIDRLVWYARVLIESAIAWSIVLALAYLLVVTSWRRKIARLECLLLWAVTGLGFTYAVIYFRHYAPTPILELFGLHAGPLTVAAELPDWTNPMDDKVLACFAAFGLLGGWILWRVGIRPAPTPSPDAAIFE